MGVASVLGDRTDGRLGDLFFRSTAPPMSSEEHRELVMKLLEERQQLERQLHMLKLEERHGATKPDSKDQPQPRAALGPNSSITSADRPLAAQKPTLRLALRKR